MTRRVNLSVPDDLYAQVEAIALEEGRSFSNYVCFLLKQSLSKNQTTEEVATVAKNGRGAKK
jgi:hypothetical protein